MTEFNPAYIGPRADILKLIPRSVTRVLDIGCSTGKLGEQIKLRNHGIEVVGIELNEDMANLAKKRLDRVIVGDLDQIRLEDLFASNYFDCLILGDILEHLKNPWDLLTSATRLLRNDGSLIASIPNVRHFSTIVSLVFKGYWPYRERGIHDKTHLRFFALKNILEMLNKARLEIVRLERQYRIIESPHPYNRFSKWFLLLLPLRDFLTFQYLIVAQKLSKSRS